MTDLRQRTRTLRRSLLKCSRLAPSVHVLVGINFHVTIRILILSYKYGVIELHFTPAERHEMLLKLLLCQSLA